MFCLDFVENEIKGFLNQKMLLLFIFLFIALFILIVDFSVVSVFLSARIFISFVLYAFFYK